MPIADHAVVIANGGIVFSGTPARAGRHAAIRWCASSSNGEPDGPIAFDAARAHAGGRLMPFVAATRALGAAGPVHAVGAARLASRPPTSSPNSTREIYKIGARSLPIIAVGGAFVGLSVTLLGYRALDTYGATNQVSALLGLGLYRELGAGADRAAVHRPRRFVDRRRTRADARDRPDHRARPDGDRSGGQGRRAALLGRGAVRAAAHRVLLQPGDQRRLLRGGARDRHRRRHVLAGAEGQRRFPRRLPASPSSRRRCSAATAALVASYVGYHAEPTIEGTSVATTRAVVNASLLVLMFNFVLSALLFRS